MRDKNPLDSVKFFDAWGDDAEPPRPILKHHASHMMTDVFEEHSIRVYCRNRDAGVCTALEAAFRDWADRRFGCRACLATPFKQRVSHQQQQSQKQQHQSNGGLGATTKAAAAVPLKALSGATRAAEGECSTPPSKKKLVC